MSKARRKASQNEFVEKSRAQDIVESFQEVDSSKNRPSQTWACKAHPKWTEKKTEFDPD